MMKYEFSAKLWIYEGSGAWVFVTLPKDTSSDIKELTNESLRGFGSVRVAVEASDVAWQTSIFPDKKLNAYVLPIKKDVRRKAAMSPGDTCSFTIEIVDLV